MAFNISQIVYYVALSLIFTALNYYLVKYVEEHFPKYKNNKKHELSIKIQNFVKKYPWAVFLIYLGAFIIIDILI